MLLEISLPQFWLKAIEVQVYDSLDQIVKEVQNRTNFNTTGVSKKLGGGLVVAH